MEDPKPQPPTFTDAEMMRQFAHEAEVCYIYFSVLLYLHRRSNRGGGGGIQPLLRFSDCKQSWDRYSKNVTSDILLITFT